MKATLTFSCLLAVTTTFANSNEFSIIDKSASLFQQYLAVCEQEGAENQPVHLRSASREKEPCFTEMTILDLDVYSGMSNVMVAECVLCAETDIVHLANISISQASHLYQMLEGVYSHFIHVPSREGGVFIASKYPLSQTESFIGEGNGRDKEKLHFAIHGANTYYASIDSKSFSMQVINLDATEESSTTSILIGEAFATLTVIKQQFSLSRQMKRPDLLAAEMFEIVPVKHKGEQSDDRGGYKAEVEVGRSWGGKDGGHWEGSARLEAHDGRGNYVEAEVNQNDKGEGPVSARGGYEKK